MNRLGLTPHLLAATLFLVPAHGAEMTSPPAPGTAAATPVGGGMRGGRAEQILQRHDKNRDGRIDDDERAEARETMLREQMDRQAARQATGASPELQRRFLALFDADKNGQLDETERAEAMKLAEGPGANDQGRQALREQFLKRFDTDGNGKIAGSEIPPAREFLVTARELGDLVADNVRTGILERFDRNGDGRLDDAEWAEAQGSLRTRLANTPRQLEKFDRNADGKLDDAEWSAATIEIRAWLNPPQSR